MVERSLSLEEAIRKHGVLQSYTHNCQDRVSHISVHGPPTTESTYNDSSMSNNDRSEAPEQYHSKVWRETASKCGNSSFTTTTEISQMDSPNMVTKEAGYGYSGQRMLHSAGLVLLFSQSISEMSACNWRVVQVSRSKSATQERFAVWEAWRFL